MSAVAKRLTSVIAEWDEPGCTERPEWSYPSQQWLSLAQTILAAGYRKPRTINSAEELESLPAKSVILDQDGTPWVTDGDKVEPWASVCEDPYGGPIWKNSIDIQLPASVLHEGTQP